MQPVLSRVGKFVRMELADNFKVDFDTEYGGTPLYMYQNDVLVTDPYGGAGSSIMWDTGQDSTQATGNGPEPYPIATFDNPSSWPLSYYAHEFLYNDDNTNGRVSYGVRGFAPFFWVSLEEIDDEILLNSQGRHGWSTFYNTNGRPLEDFGIPMGQPIYFDSKQGLTSGLFMLGDELVKLYRPDAPIEERLCKVPNGALAFKVHIFFNDASPDAFAGIHFRKEIPNGEINQDTVFAANGLELYANKIGGIALHQNGNIIWSGLEETIVSRGYADIEVKTHNWNLNLIEIYVNGKHQTNIELQTPATGPLVGLFAYTAPDTNVRFGRRYFTDLNSLFEVIYTGRADGWLEIFAKIKALNDVPVYRANMPAIFPSRDIAPLTPRVFDKSGHEISPSFIVELDEHTLWLGTENGDNGVCCKVLSQIPGSHAGLFHVPPAALMINPLTLQNNIHPVIIDANGPITELEMHTLWAGHLKGVNL